MIGKTNSVSGTQVSGSLSVTSNGTYDVTKYASAAVSVPSTIEDKLHLVVNDDIEYELTANDTADWTSIKQYEFFHSTKLTRVAANNVTSIAQSAFAYCTNLTTADFPLVTNLDASVFRDCTSLTSVNFPLITSIPDQTFYSTSLTTADFPLVTSIVQKAFERCRNLISVNFPLVTSVGNYAFKDCSSLTSVNFPLITNIGVQVFQGCSKLTTVDFTSVTNIDASAFYQCRRLTTMYLRADSVCTLSSTTAFNSVTGLTIYVPSDLVESYKTATNWSTLVANNQVTFAAITE